jgi:hypothetical protein
MASPLEQAYSRDVRCYGKAMDPGLAGAGGVAGAGRPAFYAGAFPVEAHKDELKAHDIGKGTVPCGQHSCGSRKLGPTSTPPGALTLTHQSTVAPHPLRLDRLEHLCYPGVQSRAACYPCPGTRAPQALATLLAHALALLINSIHLGRQRRRATHTEARF